MVSRMNRPVLGDSWFEAFSTFRLNPEAFLDRRKLTRDAFCCDVLKDLYRDNIENQNKIHLLLLLQEFPTQLITDVNVLEQVVASLTNLYDILGKKVEKRLLKSQILISIMTILLSINLDQDISQFIEKTKIFLREIIYSHTEDSIIVTSACCCLEEFELFYPGVLQSELENISLACERETSATFQSYALLLNTCTKNVSINHERRLEQLENEELVTTDSFHISPIISNNLELLSLMSHTAQYRILKDLIGIVKNTSNLSPKTFKLYFNNLVISTEMPLFHLAFDLQQAFGKDLLSPQEEKFLLKQLIKLSTHPCLTSSHRLIFLEWLKCYLKYENVLPYISASDILLLLPNPFDGPLTQEKKAYILTLCIPPNSNERIVGEFLNEVASGLLKCSLLSGGIKAAPSLFRTFFIYFSSQKSECVYDSIYKLLTNIMKTSLHLTPYALSFLHSVKKYSDRNFHEKALDHMVEHILSVPVKQFHSNLECYLDILETATEECTSICRPRAVLRLLQKLFNNSYLNGNNAWCLGNSMLSLCRSLMKYHDVQIFYYDLAEVLCLIIQQFKDTDVRDRAKIYYSMLTSLSKLKVQAIFNLHSSENEGKSTLNSLVTGGESLQFALCIQKLSKPVLQMIRIDIHTDPLNNEWTGSSEPIPDILEKYHHYLTSFESILQLPFIVKHVPDVEKSFTELYSIVITTHSEPACKEMPVIEIPVLKESETQERIVSVSLVPMEPHPLVLHFKAEFTCNSSYSYVCSLPSVMLNFDDLFLPLLVPENYHGCKLHWRQMLFTALWERFMTNINSREKDSKYCQSVFTLKFKKEHFSSVVEKEWGKFIVSRQPVSEYHIAIHLPPKNHLLLKIFIVNDVPFVNLIVDNNSTLPWITLYLQSINERER